MTYPVTEIRAISADAAAILRSDGIRTTVALLRSAKTPKQRIKIAGKIGAPEKQVLDWVTAADRMRVRGIGWEYAQLLSAVGVRTACELKYRNPKKLAQAMSDTNSKRNLVRLLPSERTVERWIEDARKLPPLIRY